MPVATASLWRASLEPTPTRPSLRNDDDVDVAIVGGGYTGLWTARELLRRDPSLRVALCEKETCGYGASGRNGGWASAYYPQSDASVGKHFGANALRHLRQILHQSVGDLGATLASDGVDADFVHGGTLKVARSGPQRARLLASVAEAHESGLSTSDISWLEPEEMDERLRVSASQGGTFSPHCARVHPLRLAQGLANVCAQLGVAIYEQTPVLRVHPAHQSSPARVITPSGQLRARYVVLATEGFTPTFPRHRRDVVPLYSLMIATAPLEPAFWRDAGLANYETFSDDRHLLIYAQRTSDDRLAFGGRGAPYHFGSRVADRYVNDEKIFARLEDSLRELFPRLSSDVTHRWGGPLAMPRDHSPFVRVDHHSGLAAAGGYTGDGVVLSLVAARALADLLTRPDEPTPYTTLPFVAHESRRWEHEPLRWLGINAAVALASYGDRVERRRNRTSRAVGLLDRLMGTSS